MVLHGLVGEGWDSVILRMYLPYFILYVAQFLLCMKVEQNKEMLGGYFLAMCFEQQALDATRSFDISTRYYLRRPGTRSRIVFV